MFIFYKLKFEDPDKNDDNYLNVLSKYSVRRTDPKTSTAVLQLLQFMTQS